MLPKKQTWYGILFKTKSVTIIWNSVGNLTYRVTSAVAKVWREEKATLTSNKSLWKETEIITHIKG
jgi:hypothetical protein